MVFRFYPVDCLIKIHYNIENESVETTKGVSAPFIVIKQKKAEMPLGFVAEGYFWQNAAVSPTIASESARVYTD